MTFWAKVLTIIVFVLSIAFASMSAVIFAKREDYRQQLKVERADRAREVKSLQEELAKVKGQLESRTAELQNAATQLESRQLQIDKLSAELEQKTRELLDWKSQFLAQQDLAKKLSQNIDTLTQTYKKVAAENESLRAENRKLLADLTSERTRASKLEKLNAELRDERDKLKTRLASAEETIRMNEEVFAELARRNIEARPIIEGMLAVPEVRAKVVTVDPETNIVILNAGRKQGVKKNFNFTVYRGDKFVGQVNVFDLQDDLCAARIVTQKMPIQRGDDAATRLQ